MFVTNFVNHLSSYFEEIVEKDGLCGGFTDCPLPLGGGVVNKKQLCENTP